MAVTVKSLIPATAASNLVVSELYSTDLNVTAIIDKFTARNLGTAPATLTVYLTPITPVPADHTIIVVRTIPPSGTYVFPEIVGQVLNGGDGVYAIASSEGIVIRASGREIN